MQRHRSKTVTLDDILITEELPLRSPRAPNWQAENQALHTLARQMAQDSESLLQTLVDSALELCQAGTAGVSLLETTLNGEEVFRWNVLAGALEQYVGATIPRNFSPCGVCLDRSSPVLFSHPERFFTYFQAANTPVVEGLVLPLIADDRILGTIWIMSHDEQRYFDSEDVRIMTSLADFTAVALLLHQRQTKELLAANAALEAENAERKQVEERLRALIENLPGGAAFIVDRDLRYLLAEGEALSIAGFKPEDLVGRTIFEVLPPELAANYEVLYRKALAGELFEREHHAHGNEYISRGTPLRSANGEVYAVLAVSYDITERKQAEAKLRHAAEMDAFRVTLSDALRSLSDPIEIQQAAMRVVGDRLVVDCVLYAEIADGGETIVINDNYVRGDRPKIVGQFPASNFGTANKILRAGQTYYTSHIDRDDNLTDVEREAFHVLGIASCVAVPLIKKGRWVSNLGAYHCEPHQWTADEIRLLQETAERTWEAVERARGEDVLRESEIQRIREQTAREEERQRAESLAELDRAKTIFFSNVSHEFRTPLTLLLAPLQDALSDSVNPLAQAQRERLELAHRNATKLLKLVNTLLDFSRIEAGRMEAVYEPTDLATFTTDLASVFRSAIERAGLRLRLDCPPLPEPVYVDRSMWEKIVLNLLSNAFKFTFEGEIAVRLHRADGNRVMLQIQDTGTGITPEELPHLFDRFYQVRGAKGRTHEGSGIGLALVHELVRLHGGTIDVNSTVGQKTCFTIAIPLGTEHLQGDRLRRVVGDRITATPTLESIVIGTAPYVEEVERWLPDGSRRAGGETYSLLSLPSLARILVVDDNADMRDYLTRILSQYVQVEAVADGAKALAAVQEQVPDLVLTDVMMPQLDGFELLYALRANPRTREIPIILLSARAGEESVIEGLQAGADDYLIKPFSALELVWRVNNHLQMAKLRSEALQQERTTSKRKDELLSIVSHELNTPLVSILGWTRLLRSVPPSQAMLLKSLDTIERNAELQAKLIADLLDISRVTAGKLCLSLEPVKLESVIASAIATVSQIVQAKAIDLIWQPTTALSNTNSIVVMGDRDRLGQVICNLLTNAIKFTPESGTVVVKLSIDAAYAQIRVIDTGIGIAADLLPCIFDRFRQAEDTYASKGLGLGLAIARHIVELHNGTIDAESAGVGQGAIFIVNLPLL